MSGVVPATQEYPSTLHSLPQNKLHFQCNVFACRDLQVFFHSTVQPNASGWSLASPYSINITTQISYLCVCTQNGNTLQSLETDEQLKLLNFSTSHHKTDQCSPYHTFLWWIQQYGPAEGIYDHWGASTKTYPNLLQDAQTGKIAPIKPAHNLLLPTMVPTAQRALVLNPCRTNPFTISVLTLHAPTWQQVSQAESNGSIHTNHSRHKLTMNTISPFSYKCGSMLPSNMGHFFSKIDCFCTSWDSLLLKVPPVANMSSFLQKGLVPCIILYCYI